MACCVCRLGEGVRREYILLGEGARREYMHGDIAWGYRTAVKYHVRHRREDLP